MLKHLQSLRAWLIGLPRGVKRSLMIAADTAILAASLVAGFYLQYDRLSAVMGSRGWIYVVGVFVALVAFAALGLYRAVLRYITFRLMLAVFFGAALSACAVWVAGNTVSGGSLPASLSIIYWLNAIIGVTGARMVARWFLVSDVKSRVPVVIYGAGEAGAQLATALALGGQMFPIAYVDEKASLHGATVAGVRVLAPERLPTLISAYGVRRVLLAIPGATRRRRAEIIQQLVDLGVHVQTVPDLYDLLSGRAGLADLREISIADLLGRDPVAPQASLLGASIKDKSVLVTGAGGSIGSELCRQIIGQAPSRLVLFELSELALYEIERELRSVMQRRELDFELVALLGNARHRERLRDVMLAYGVQTVYHAAAYKHVPIVEQNIVEGAYNNVLATWYTAETAVEAKVETFVLVSTDKAVHPSNVMGATKRFAEIVLQAMQQRQPTTRFCMVRFGNVLGSSGSVVPLFQEQIRTGGPVTVTHQDVRRYFMTIPEAASLVLQAGSMAKGGEVFVLDMGQPVKIDELARRMIALSGRTLRDGQNPEGDIEIHYTGLRPGEKLYEELLIGENVAGTDHPMIMQAAEHAPGWDAVQALLVEMQRALLAFDCDRVRKLLGQAVQEYRPASQMHDLVWSVKNGQPSVPEPLPERRVADTVVRLLRPAPRTDL
jgi:FlaA1/EpsC-like NDP-sugar epimerase